ncbi:MAG: methyl-accepting chemotaxis protein [Alphaproteobacteria bacterium]|nr:methyl-accepting chemotaxis protein [Alphaproteobacteria bacterium]
MRIGAKLAASFFVVVIISAGLGAAGWFGLSRYADSVASSDRVNSVNAELGAVKAEIPVYRQTSDSVLADKLTADLSALREYAAGLGEEGLLTQISDYNISFESLVGAQTARNTALEEISQTTDLVGAVSSAIVQDSKARFSEMSQRLTVAIEEQKAQLNRRQLADALLLKTADARRVEGTYLNRRTQENAEALNEAVKDLFVVAINLRRATKDSGSVEKAAGQVAKNVGAYRKAMQAMMDAPFGSDASFQAAKDLESASKRISAFTNGMSKLIQSAFDKAGEAADAARIAMTTAEKQLETGLDLRAQVLELRLATRDVVAGSADPQSVTEGRAALATATATAEDLATMTDAGEQAVLALNSYAGAYDRLVASLMTENQSAEAMQAAAANTKTETSRIVANYEAARNGEQSLAQTIMIVGTLVAAAIAATLAVLLTLGLAKPVQRLTGAMGTMADGDLEVTLTDQNRKDEIGAMVASLDRFKEQLLQGRRLEAERAEQEQRAEMERKRSMNEMADQFESSVGKVVETVRDAVSSLEGNSGKMSAAASETSSQATTVAAAAEEASSNVQTVASATDELSRSIGGVAEQVGRSADVADTAVREADRTSSAMNELSGQVEKITEIVDLITQIAEQTNLLALNATIEAARAGEAGKGFAVVATEVKSLATQTAQATDQIAQQIGAVRDGTAEASQAINSITGVISEMKEISTSVSDAIAQQTQATNEIANNVTQAAQGTQEVSTTITAVEGAARETGVTAAEINESATDLSQQAETLSVEVNRFLSEVRDRNRIA